MRIDPYAQLITAVTSLLLGVAAGILYDFFRVFRRRLKKRFVTVVTDIVFCFAFFTALFLLGYTIGQGRQRMYMLIMAILGGAIYFAVFSKVMMKVLGFFADFLTEIIRFTIFPFKVMALSTKKILFFLQNSFYYKKKWYTIELNFHIQPPRKTTTVKHELKGHTNETEKGRYYY